MGPTVWIRSVAFFAWTAFFFAAPTDDPPWTEVRSPHFTIVTDGPEAAAQSLARQAEQTHALLASMFPHLRRDPHGEVIILALDENVEEWRTRLGEQAGHVRLGDGLYQGGEYHHYIGIRQRAGHASDEVLGHEYFHLIAALNFREIPLWLNEGLASFCANALTGGRAQPVPHAYAELLRRSAWIPLEELFSLDKHSPQYADAATAPLFYAESWAVTHYLLTGEGGRRAESVWQLLRRLDQGVPYAAALHEELGDAAALELSVKKHLESAAALTPPIQPKTSPLSVGQYKSRRLRASESAAVRGDFFLHVGNLAAAESALRESLQGDRNSAAAAESLGLLYLKKQQHDEAARWFARAAEQDSAGALAHYYHAEFLAAAAKDSTALEEAEAHLRLTLARDDNFARAHAALAGIYLLRGDLDRALHSAERAASLEPRELAYQLDLARILARRGDMKGATEIAQQALRNSLTGPERARAENLLQYLEQSERAQIEVKRLDRELTERSARGPQPPAKPVPPAPPGQTTEKLSGPLPAQAYAWGTIKKVTCTSGSELQITLDASEGPLTLRARNYAVVPYYDAAATRTKRFDPCRHLADTFAGIVFRPVRGGAHQGEILSIELHPKPEVSTR